MVESDIKNVDFLEGLNSDQERVFKAVLTYLSNKDSRMFLISGKAGTGKTFVLQRLVTYLLDKKKRVGVTATTHKAVKVLNEKLPSNVGTGTIHSLLGLKESIQHDGTIKFLADKMNSRPVDNVDIIVIDESSMLQDEIYSELYNLSIYKKIIFIGDHNQIPPVGLPCSMPFADGLPTSVMGRVELTQIVRQAEGNPIISLASRIIDSPYNKSSLVGMLDNDSWTGKEGIAYVEDKEELFRKLYVTRKYKENKDYVKIVAWTNAVVQRTSLYIRAMLFPDAVEAVVVGDLFVMNSPFVVPSSNDDCATPRFGSIMNGAEFEVMSFEHSTLTVLGMSLAIYEVKGRVLGSQYIVTLPILHEDSYEVFSKASKELLSRAKGAERKDSGRFWVEYYTFIRSVCDCAYAYAVTAHKSQGSTYENTIIVESDILKNQNVVEMNKIRYTAVTRSSKRVFLV